MGSRRFPLIHEPSPLHRLERLERALAGRAELWIKREDLLPLGFGGNKLRNLEFLLGDALAHDADVVITAGRRWSNHCRLTAAAGAKAGLDVHLVLSGPPAAEDGPSARIARLLGATIHQRATADRAEREATIERLAGELRARGRRPYVIPVGGSSVIGALGQVRAGAELAAQVAAWPAPPDVVVVPSATGGTQAGVLAGLRSSGLPTRVVGVLVARPEAELRPAIEAILAALPGHLLEPAPRHDEVELDGSWLGGGYGVRSEAADEAADLLARTEGLLVDPIYTAKALAWLVDAVRSGALDGRRVVFWHAGGTLGVLEPLDDVT